MKLIWSFFVLGAIALAVNSIVYQKQWKYKTHDKIEMSWLSIFVKE